MLGERLSGLLSGQGRLRAAASGLLLGICAAAAPVAQAQAPGPQVYPLQIKSPFAGKPQSLDSDSAGNFLVTASSLRSLTIWSRQGKDAWSPSVIYAPNRNEYASGRYVAAITPDAKHVAFAAPPLSDDEGGYKVGTARIYIIERATERVVTTLEGDIPTYAMRLRFSPDGQYLAAVLADGCGLRMWSQAQWTASGGNQSPQWSKDLGYGGTTGVSACCLGRDSRNCAPLPDGRDVVFTGLSGGGEPWLLTLSDNGLRTYAMAGQELTETSYAPADGMGLKAPGKIAVAPGAQKIAIGDVDAAQIVVLEKSGAGYGRPLARTIPSDMLSNEGKEGNENGSNYFPNPVWVEKDGNLLVYAFGYFPARNLSGRDDYSNNVVVFNLTTDRPSMVEIKQETDTILYVSQPSAGAPGELFFVSLRRLGKFDTRYPGPASPAPVSIIRERRSVDFRGNDDEFALLLKSGSAELYFPTILESDKFAVLGFDFDQQRVVSTTYHRTLAEVRDAIRQRKGLGYYGANAPDNKDWNFGQILRRAPPKFFGQVLPTGDLDGDEVSLSGVEMPDRKQIVWGTSQALRIIDGAGQLRCERSISSEAHRINVSADRRLIVVGHGDGVIRWYRLNDNPKNCLPLVLSLYLTHNADDTWGFLAWLPNGKFTVDGSAAGQQLACYPVETSAGLTSCVDFQTTDGYYAPDEVRKTLSDATSSERAGIDPGAQRTIVRAQQAEKISVRFDADYDVFDARFAVSLDVGGWSGAPRYLSLTAGAQGVPYTFDGKDYPAGQPLPMPGPGTFKLTLTLPRAVQKKDAAFQIQATIHQRLNPDGTPEKASRQQTTKSPAYFQPVWRADDNPDPKPKKRKLWALLIGFSEASRATPALRFAHEDAMDLARFLQRDIVDKQTPGSAQASGRFDEVKIRLIVAPPGINQNSGLLASNPKIDLLRRELKGQISVYFPAENDRQRYDDVVRSEVTALKEGIGDPDTDNDWEHVVLVYFSGHGYSVNVTPQEGAKYVELNFVTPDLSPDLKTGKVSLDWIVDELSELPYARVLIVDACRSEVSPGAGVRPADAAIASLKFVKDAGKLSGGGGWTVFFSSNVGHYSYEQADFGIKDFVSAFDLWPTNGTITGKGNSVFSVGFLASLLCGEGTRDPAFTSLTSEWFLKNIFFDDKNLKWKALRAKLASELGGRNLKFAPPEPQANKFSFRPEVTLRSSAKGIPLCF